MPHHQEAAQQRQPHQDIKQQRRGELGRHHLKIAHRRGHQRLERAGKLLQRKQAHRDDRRRQQQDQPEERRDVKQLGHRHGRRLLQLDQDDDEAVAHQEQRRGDDDVAAQGQEEARQFPPDEGPVSLHQPSSSPGRVTWT